MLQININVLILVFLMFMVLIYINNKELFYNNETEHLTSTSNEAIQSVSSIYNSQNMTVNNLTTTVSSSLNNATLGGTSTLITPTGSFPSTGSGNSGLGLYWNQSGDGKMDLLSYGQNGNGGFAFWTINTNSKNGPTKIATLDGSGNLTITGNLVSGGTISGGAISSSGAISGTSISSSGAISGASISSSGSISGGSLTTGSSIKFPYNWSIYSSFEPGFNWSGKNGAGGIFRIDSTSKAKFEIDQTGLFGTPSNWGNKGFF